MVKLDEMSQQFREGYITALSVARNCLHGSNVSEACENAILPYKRENRSADYIYGMEVAVSEVVNEYSRRMFGPKERGRRR